MDRILLDEYKNTAQQVLLWVSCAKRPLTMRELQHAIAFNSEEQKLPTKDLPEPDLLLSTCTGLVLFDQHSGYVRLLHETTQAWLEDRKPGFFPGADVLIAQTCLAYLSNEAFSSGGCKGHDQMRQRLAKYPLLDYAANYWGSHLKGDAETALRSEALTFLEKPGNLSCSTQLLMEGATSLRFEFQGHTETYRLMSEHVCARFGLMELLALVKIRDETG